VGKGRLPAYDKTQEVGRRKEKKIIARDECFRVRGRKLPDWENKSREGGSVVTRSPRRLVRAVRPWISARAREEREDVYLDRSGCWEGEREDRTPFLVGCLAHVRAF